MPRYLVQVGYTAAANAAFVAKPQDRVAGVKALFEKAGGTLHSMDYCFGEYDIVIMVSVPDDATMAAIRLIVSAQGHCSSLHATRLISADEYMTAQQKAHGMSYAPPAKA
jgi:uncharacterized protein with GYD domain